MIKLNFKNYFNFNNMMKCYPMLINESTPDQLELGCETSL